jgi:hypothetical protein
MQPISLPNQAKEHCGRSKIASFALPQGRASPMSALGQKQTSEDVRVMSALPPKADNNNGGGFSSFLTTFIFLPQRLSALSLW